MNVALYVRRSTNERLQADSLKVQEQILRAYAREHSMEIVEIFTDSASGTSTKHRAAFLRMVEKITHGAPFEAVLVRDVSRFGRFFDMDEGAFFEVLFLGHGVRTVYCEEAFAQDTSPMACLVKGVRRVMASEYSRDRSRLVRYAQSRATRLGFHAGGPPPYGMRRVMVTPGGRKVRPLRPGEWKALSNYRIRLVPGDPEAVATVRRIFDLYDKEGLGVTAIAAILNEAGVPGPQGERWWEPAVAGVLTNSRYAGLGGYRPRRKGLSDPLPASQVEDLTVQGAPGHEPLIDLAQFRRVEARMKGLTRRRTDDDLAMEAREAFERHGYVEPRMLGHMPSPCSWGTFKTRFRRGVEEALEEAYATQIEERKAAAIDLLRTQLDVAEVDGGCLVDQTIRIGFQGVFPHRRRSGDFWLVRRPANECEAVIGLCINGSGSHLEKLLLVSSERLSGRTHGLYVPCDGRAREPVASDELPGRVGRLRYASGQVSEERLLAEARAQPIVSFTGLARSLGWPKHVVRGMYWRLVARREWFPPLKRKAGRRIEVVCPRCGKSRLVEPARALRHRSGLCSRCARRRPRHKVEVRCPRCGRVAMRWPSAVRKLSCGAQTVCRGCRIRAGIRKMAPAPLRALSGKREF
jgi:DNA invertase Pin-like site-specific DNA recombinase